MEEKNVGAELIASERARQIEIGYDGKHDHQHPADEFMRAAMAYLYAALGRKEDAMGVWCWGKDYFKPRDVERNLVKAGALIAAAIDRQREQ